MKLIKENIQHKLHEVIFEADTFWGKLFDLVLIAAILLSVLVVMLESVESIKVDYGEVFTLLEWIFTGLFTAEYIARIISLKKPIHYVKSFYGIIDLLAFLPMYFSFLIAGTPALIVFRTMRLLRIFRILKLVRYLSEANKLIIALKASMPKITVFIVSMVCITLLIGTFMYLIEGGEHGFDSIPRSIYWAIVTMTTVGYGDIAPVTVMGQTLASFVMILGYGIIAVPTGIVTSEIQNARFKSVSRQACPSCSKEGHDEDAIHCKFCGEKL